MGLDADGVQFFRSGSYVLKNVRFVDAPFSSIERRLELMDRLGVDHQVLSPNPLTYFYRQSPSDGIAFARAHNDEMAATVRAEPRRFSGFAQLPLQDPEASVAELTRAVEALGLVGSYIGSDIAGRLLSDEAFAPLWRAHERLGVPCVVHPAPVDVERAPGEGATSRAFDLDIVIGFAFDETATVAQLIFGGVLDRHPALHIHIPHAGGAAPYLRGRLETALAKRPWAKGLLQRSFEDIWRQLSFDCLIRAGANMAFLVESAGADRVLLGTNFAGWDQDDDIIRNVDALPLDEGARRAILADNARRLFGIRA
jgi:aminocarboxymuconate-semialdehyde decarboxylase